MKIYNLPWTERKLLGTTLSPKSKECEASDVVIDIQGNFCDEPECDEPILKHLIDATSTKLQPQCCFSLEFEFLQSNILTKTYMLKIAPEVDFLRNLRDQKSSMRLAVKSFGVPGKKTTKGRFSDTSLSSHIFKNDSFFNFFNPPRISVNNLKEIVKN